MSSLGCNSNTLCEIIYLLMETYRVISNSLAEKSWKINDIIKYECVRTKG